MFCHMELHCRSRTATSPGYAGPRGLCLPCEVYCQDAIHQLPVDYRRLRAELPPSGASFGSAIPSGSVDPPLPLNQYVDERMRHIHWALCEWVTPVREKMQLSPVDVHKLIMQDAVIWAAHTLSKHFSALMALNETPYRSYETGKVEMGSGLVAAIEFSQIHYRSLAFLGENRLWEERRMPCPQGSGCGRYTLGTWVGSGKIECCSSGCGWSCTQSEYENYVMTLVPPS